MSKLPMSLRGQLLLTHLLVIVVGVGSLFLAATWAAPPFFERHMAGVGAFHPAMGPRSGVGPPPEMFATMSAQLNDAFRGALGEALLVAAGAALVVALGVSLLVSQQVAGAVRRLALASRRIAAGHYDERVPSHGPGELQQLAASFNEMAAMLQDAERRRMELIGDVAHELRTPIATIEGYLEGLLDGVVPANERTWAMLHGEAGRLRRLAEDLQQLSRAEAHQLSLAVRPVAPAAIVQAAVDRLQGDFDAIGLALQATVPREIPMVEADLDRAVQVLTNVLTNALRYTPPPGQVEISVTPTTRTIRFQVRDTGVGVAPEHLPHLFERFYRVERFRSRTRGGAGIGLTIAKALVEAMGGHITAASPGLGQGTTFTVELPRAG